ncbi:MAG: DUF4399 domain-containing protein [Myxococcota bacterium]
MKQIQVGMLLACMIMGSCGSDNNDSGDSSNTQNSTSSITNTQARIFFEQPKDGAVVTSPVTFQFSATGVTVEQAGEVKPNAGHFHVLIDNALGYIPKGQTIPADDKHVHFGDGGKEGTVDLPAGEHKLTLQFGNGQHQSAGKELSHTISITVKE